MSIKNMDETLCSPAEGLPQQRLLEMFSSFVTDLLSAHATCM